ncbi:calcineurin-binding protein [Moniliophthora roreri MCA 2997]|uniref:Calcineurin-binding protein n=1 Tax=Moniliophthora roreri (strain MCA 2997) TaxID=1381753 RepID=V2XHA0_MONRO|nr:calcineurin-binding protein [Moniliophthora roreri MCA 2997]KAI3616026.1 calcineurin-binding protein [Moniliophthora roreri]
MPRDLVISIPSSPSRHSRSSSLSSSSSHRGPRKTNSLAITPLPKAFFHPEILHHLHAHFATYGRINQWVPLQGFGRILIVYEKEDDAEEAKTANDPIVLAKSQNRDEIVLRVYRADPNPLIPENGVLQKGAYLRPPETERNFLISPPGSPPVGWEPMREDPPNATPLADDLIAALKNLQVRQHASPGIEILLDPEEGSGVSVVLEDYDSGSGEEDNVESDGEWIYGVTMPSRSKWKVTPVPTAMPPVRSPTPRPVPAAMPPQLCVSS